MCRGADTFGIPTRCHVVAGDVKQTWDKPGVKYARPVSTAGSNLASSVRGAYSDGFADLASRARERAVASERESSSEREREQ